MAAFTVYWRRDYWKSLPREDPGPRLSVLFGGPHRSQPSFLRAGVEPGDRLFPVTVWRRRVYVLASMRAAEIVEVDSTIDPEMRGLLRRYAEWSFLAESRTTEVVIGSQGTPIRRDRVVPGEWPSRQLRGISRLRDDTAAELAAITGEGLAIVS